MKAYVSRLVDGLLAEILAAHPAVLLVGPRACGKTTSARRHAATVVSLDATTRAAPFLADPDAALRAITNYPVLLDEWQEVPGVLGAVKRAVDAEHRPGRFILSGSARAPITTSTWPGTGRLITVSMAPLTVRECAGRVGSDTFLTTLADGRIPANPVDPPDLLDYVEIALRGGFPEPAIQLNPVERRRWYEAYAEQLLRRDVASAGYQVDPPRLAAYTHAYALNAAGVADHSTIFRAAGISRPTADRYEALLRALFVADALPAWTTNRLKRLGLQPKRVIVDPGLWAALVGVDVGAVMADGALLGRLIEIFVISQLRAELPLTPRMRLHHLRTQEGRREVDIVADVGAGRIVGIEVKATSAPSVADARHLAWLRDELGPGFVRGVVLHTGPSVFVLGDRLLAVPIASLWS